MNVHFIAIGGSAMHNLAIAMHKKGFTVTGSDDEVFEPSKSRLEKWGLLPAKMGWDTATIHSGLDAVILGMHARNDNPELEKAKELGLKIYSYPEYIYEQTKNKIRVVVGGSHGKTTITAIILHVLNFHKIDCDYLVGAQLEGFDTMVKLTKEAKIAIIEGDEYLSSPIDRRPKFHLYKPNIAIISGIAWDHINVFPTFENYIEQFKIFIDLIELNGTLVYCMEDAEVEKLAETNTNKIKKIPYGIPEYKIENGITYLETKDKAAGNSRQEAEDGRQKAEGENITIDVKEILSDNSLVPLLIFGEHNLMNLNGARLVCIELGLTDEQFYQAIQSFNGASKRLELVARNNYSTFYKDFAHSPSKLKATTAAVKQQFPDRKLIACMELHTFSSLNENFLELYKGSMELADEAIVYFNPHTIEHKKLKPITIQQVKDAFGGNNITAYTDASIIITDLKKRDWKNTNLLMMSSGNFDGVDLKKLAKELNFAP